MAAIIVRHAYQSNQGGLTHCSLDRDVPIVVSSPPLASRKSSGASTSSSVRPVPRSTFGRTTTGSFPAA